MSADAAWREVAFRVLTTEGYEVVAAAHSGHATLGCLTAARLDAVVADFSMDDMSGPALVERLRRHHPGVQALYLAPPGTPEADNVLVRPFTRDDLLARLEQSLATTSASPKASCTGCPERRR